MRLLFVFLAILLTATLGECASESFEAEPAYMPGIDDAFNIPATVYRVKRTGECASSPCQNAGTCVEDSSASRRRRRIVTIFFFTCICPHTYTGSLCETEVNECDSNPCSNGGTCVDHFDGYTCQCVTGFRGTNCLIEDKCASNPCQNGGSCEEGQNQVLDLTIMLDNSGSLTDTDIVAIKNATVEMISTLGDDDRCALYTFGDSIVGLGSGSGQTDTIPILAQPFVYMNDVDVSGTGRSGREQLVYLIQNTIFAIETWTPLFDTIHDCINYTYVHRRPEAESYIVALTDGDDTSSGVNSYKNNDVDEFPDGDALGREGLDDGNDQDDWGAPYYGPDTIDGGTANSPVPIYTIGLHVSADNANRLEEVAYTSGGGARYYDASDNSLLAGIFDQISGQIKNGFNCTCLPLFVGVDCSTPMDVCESSPCLNAATCIDNFPNYTCACPTGFAGEQCETEVDECASSPCHNGATCSNLLGAFYCDCIVGYFGNQCEVDIDECASSPCQNSATCTDTVNGYTCTCAGGTAGDHCETNVDECLSNPCLNGATCVDGVDGYTCSCVGGHTGILCESDIDECASSPCQNGATCAQVLNAFACTCVTGYTGVVCESNIDECASSPCQNGATCIDQLNTYTCTCASGWFGSLCETDTDECESSPCLNSATCVDIVNGHTCTCPSGYTGAICESEVDECHSSPCQNGAFCSDIIDGFTCACLTGFTGDLCESNIDECASTPCQNVATCTDLLNGYTCTCGNGYAGTHCETNIDECTSSPCQNAGTCSDAVNGYACTCVAGYTGILCESEQDECLSSPCENGGNCTDMVNGYTCTCPTGFFGLRCEVETDECESSPCHNGATCIDVIGGYQCTCVAGYTGTLCESDIDECASSPCIHGVCLPMLNRFVCDCDPGYVGVYCETDVDECHSSPCQSGATCVDLVDGYSCTCLNGFTGTVCESPVDECTSNPCQNGGLCTDELARFTCTCVPGYTGVLCESDIDECASSPCLNAATCVDQVDHFVCVCPTGFFGALCDVITNECGSSPCQNGATCVDVTAAYTCTCASGYIGTLCESEIDECDSSPCQNAGVCTDIVDGYSCACIAGYTGADCESNIDECVSSPCQNGASCIDFVNGFSCGCVAGFAGSVCETNVDDCVSSPCQNAGVCVDGVNSYTCNCATGWHGADCETDTDECSSSPCQFSGTCTDTLAGYTCSCDAGTVGDHCETDVDECGSSPCMNNAVCSDALGGFSCTCTAGFTGVLCESDIDECASSPCQNGGACTDGVDGFTCACASGYTGGICESEIDECASSPCQHGGICTDLVDGFSCNCIAGWFGTACEVEDDECASSPCLNAGACVDEINGFSCNCVTGYQGVQCETNIDECASSPCVNGASCIDGVNFFGCTCLNGYQGDQCETNIDECASSACQNGATCVDGVDEFTCTCASGFTGIFCESDIDECASSPCQNAGVCVDGINMFTCNCDVGWFGLLCDTNTNECGSSPCTNGGTCVDVPSAYFCVCPSGFTGAQCESDVDECTSSPCHNGAVCADLVDMFSCACPGGYTGVTCETDIDECASMPCQNGGVCTDGVDGFFCSCAAGYSGTLCETDIDECASSPCMNGGTCTDNLDAFVCDCSPVFYGLRCEIDVLTVSSTFVTSSLPETPAMDVAIGEIVTLQAVIRLPPGTNVNAALLKVNSAMTGLEGTGLTGREITSITFDAGVTSTTGHTLEALTNSGNLAVATDGSAFDINFGTLTNTGTGVAYITVEYTARVTTPSPASTTTMRDAARVNWSGGTTDVNKGPQMTIVSPVLGLDTVVEGDVVNVLNVNDVFNVTFVVHHEANSNSTAFLADWSFAVPDEFDLVAVYDGGFSSWFPSSSNNAFDDATVVSAASVNAVGVGMKGSEGARVNGTWSVIVLGAGIAAGSVTGASTSVGLITVEMRVNADAVAGEIVDMLSAVEWTSAPTNGVSASIPSVAVSKIQINSPPVAADDFVTVPEDAPATPIHVLFNDTDGEGGLDETSCALVSGVSMGTLSLNSSSCVFTYTPFADVFGVDSFTYNVCDNLGLCTPAPATVTITITGLPEPPLTRDAVLTVPGNSVASVNVTELFAPGESTLSTFEVLSVDGTGTLSMPVTTPMTVAPTTGLVAVPSVGPTGVLNYTAPLYWTGNVTIVAEVCDVAAMCTPLTITIVVEPPVTLDAVDDAIFISAADVQSGQTSWEVILTTNDGVSDIDPSSAVVVVEPPLYGGVVIAADGAGGVKATYSPSDMLNVRNDSFTYSLTDLWGQVSLANVSITTDLAPSASTLGQLTTSGCTGGQVMTTFALIFGFSGFTFGTVSGVWVFFDFMQAMTATGLLNAPLPDFYANYTACFSWMNLAESLPWNHVSKDYLYGFEKTARAAGQRHLLTMEQYTVGMEMSDPVHQFFLAVFFYYCIVLAILVVLLLLAVLHRMAVGNSRFGQTRWNYTRKAHYTFTEGRQDSAKYVFMALGLIYRWTMFSFVGLWIASCLEFAVVVRQMTTASASGVPMRLIMAVIALVWVLLHVVYYVYWMRGIEDILMSADALTKEERRYRAIGMSYRLYKYERRWFYLTVFARKILLGIIIGAYVGVSSTSANIMQIVLLCVVYAVYLGLVLFVRPFLSKWRMLIDLVMNLLVLVIFVLLAIFFASPDNTSLGATATWVAYASVVIFFILTIPLFVLLMRSLCCGSSDTDKVAGSAGAMGAAGYNELESGRRPSVRRRPSNLEGEAPRFGRFQSTRGSQFSAVADSSPEPSPPTSPRTLPGEDRRGMSGVRNTPIRHASSKRAEKSMTNLSASLLVSPLPTHRAIVRAPVDFESSTESLHSPQEDQPLSPPLGSFLRYKEKPKVNKLRQSSADIRSPPVDRRAEKKRVVSMTAVDKSGARLDRRTQLTPAPVTAESAAAFVDKRLASQRRKNRTPQSSTNSLAAGASSTNSLAAGAMRRAATLPRPGEEAFEMDTLGLFAGAGNEFSQGGILVTSNTAGRSSEPPESLSREMGDGTRATALTSVVYPASEPDMGSFLSTKSHGKHTLRSPKMPRSTLKSPASRRVDEFDRATNEHEKDDEYIHEQVFSLEDSLGGTSALRSGRTPDEAWLSEHF